MSFDALYRSDIRLHGCLVLLSLFLGITAPVSAALLDAAEDSEARIAEASALRSLPDETAPLGVVNPLANRAP